jgi:hypothetical protein
VGVGGSGLGQPTPGGQPGGGTGLPGRVWVGQDWVGSDWVGGVPVTVGGGDGLVGTTVGGAALVGAGPVCCPCPGPVLCPSPPPCSWPCCIALASTWGEPGNGSAGCPDR